MKKLTLFLFVYFFSVSADSKINEVGLFIDFLIGPKLPLKPKFEYYFGEQEIMDNFLSEMCEKGPSSDGIYDAKALSKKICERAASERLSPTILALRIRLECQSSDYKIIKEDDMSSYIIYEVELCGGKKMVFTLSNSEALNLLARASIVQIGDEDLLSFLDIDREEYFEAQVQ